MNRRRVKSIILTAFAAMITLAAVAGPPGSGWSVNWADEFNYWGNPKSSQWKVSNKDDWIKNGKKCQYLSSNVSVNGNALSIESHWQNRPGLKSGYHYSGGRIDSNVKFLYGYYECQSRLDWMDKHFWCTFWLWEWRANKSATEFDVMEFQHWHNTPSQSHHYRYKTGRTTPGASGTPVNSWHKWGLLWFNNHISFYIDDAHKFDSEKPANAAGDQLPILFTSSPNRDFNPARSGSYPRFFVNWVRVHKGGSVGGGGGGGGGGAGSPTTPPFGKVVSFKHNSSGKFINTRTDMANNILRADIGSNGGNGQRFMVVNAGGGVSALKSLANNQYISADKNINGINPPLAANRGAIGGWEKYQWYNAGSGLIALKASANNRFVQANLGGGGAIRAAAGTTQIGSWEKFKHTIH